MNIKIMCDKDNELLEFKNKLKKSLLKESVYKKYNIKFIKNKKIDIYIIISNDLEYIYKNSFNITKNPGLVILTSNLKAANIIGCLNITPYVYYIKTKMESIMFKIIRIYEKNTNTSSNLYFPVKKDS